MLKLNVGLRFAGNAEEAFSFYKSVFGGEFLSLQRQKEMFQAGKNPHPELAEKILYVGLPVGRTDRLSGDDFFEANGEIAQNLVQGNNVIIELHTESRSEADRLYTALSAGGQIQTPLAGQFWGDYYGDLRDRYGVCWSVSYHTAKVE